MNTRTPDLSEARQHAEAVAYGRLLAVREILDALAKQRPTITPSHYDADARNGYAEDGFVEQVGWLGGYDNAVRVVKAMRLGVEKP